VAQVYYLPAAREDLYAVWQYVSEHSSSFRTADRLIARIDKTARQYAQQPLMGEQRPELAERVRSFRVGKYVVFYVPIAEGIEVVQVIHGQRDIPQHFRTPP
jgi:toxin ParE1/3/4